MKGALVILAAGRSQRMGSPKALLPFGNSTFLECILERARPEDFSWAAVVTSPALAEQMAVQIPLLINANPELGQIRSLQTALRAGAERCPWLMVALVDQPAVQQGTYLRLGEAADAGHADLWVPVYQGRRGHPVVFSRACFQELLQATDARSVVAGHREARREIEVEDPAILQDFDTPADLRNWLKSEKTPLVERGLGDEPTGV